MRLGSTANSGGHAQHVLENITVQKGVRWLHIADCYIWQTRECKRLIVHAMALKLKRRAFFLVAVQAQTLTRSPGSSSPITLQAARSASPQAAESSASLPMSKSMPMLTTVRWDSGAPPAGSLQLSGRFPPLKRSKHVALVAWLDATVVSKL